MSTTPSPILKAVAEQATVFVQDSRHLANDAYLISIYRGDVRRKGAVIPVESILLTSPVIYGMDLARYVGDELAGLLRRSSEGGQHLAALTPEQVLKIEGFLVEQIERELATAFENPEWRKLVDMKQLIEDMIETRKERSEAIPQAWVDKLAGIKAQLRSETTTGDALYSNEVEGHPMVDGAPMLRNLIPIKVSSADEALRKLYAAQDLYGEMLGARARAEHAQGVARTAAEKRSATATLKDLDNRGVTAEAVDTLRNVTLVELQRLAREAEVRFGPAAEADQSPSPAADASTLKPRKASLGM